MYYQNVLRHRHKDRHRDTKSEEHKEKGTQKKGDTKTREGEITNRHFRRIKGELTDQKDFIRGDH